MLPRDTYDGAERNGFGVHQTNLSTISSSQSETESRNKTSDAPDVQRDESRQTTASCMPGSSNSLAEELLLQTHPSPVTMLQHGNSDPFSMSSVEITPTNHYLVKYWQEVLVQTVVPSEILSTASISVISCDDENFDMIGHPERLHFLPSLGSDVAGGRNAGLRE